MTVDCPFYTIAPERIVAESALTITIRDAYPISSGYTLIISKRHFCSFFEATPEEERELMQALHTAKSQIDFEFSPMGYNIGIDDGSAAGQTIPHLHIHLIPRYEGDSTDPQEACAGLFRKKLRTGTSKIQLPSLLRKFSFTTNQAARIHRQNIRENEVE